ncbi:MAG: arylesterase, partial [Gemmatimonadetes bacterium]|nr:arylesterase [Gemmatimonadota bacterium]
MPKILFIISSAALLACAPDVSTVPASAEPDGVDVSSAPANDLPNGRPTVVFVGTSLTAGLGLLREEDTYVSRVAELADSAGSPIRVVNAGVSGETSAGGLRRLDWVLREPLDVLIIELGANDGLRGQDPAALEKNLIAVIERAKSRYPEVAIIIAGMQAPTNFGLAYTAQFAKVFSDVATASGSALIPFLLEGVAGIPELNQGDRIHPTAEGHRIMAGTV